MNAKQQKQVSAKINKAMLLLLDAQKMVDGSAADWLWETHEEQSQRAAVHQDIDKAMNELHWANGRI